MKKKILIPVFLILIFLQSNSTNAGWFGGGKECGTLRCLGSGIEPPGNNRHVAGYSWAHWYIPGCDSRKTYAYDKCKNKFNLLEGTYTHGANCQAVYSNINCLQYGEYCSERICKPCQCEQGECCNIATVGAITRGCLYEDSGTGCRFINNVSAGICTGTSETCNIYDENTNNICSDTLAYGWNSQIPKSFDYPQTENNRIGSCCGDDESNDSGIIAVDGKFLCAKKTPTKWDWLHVVQSTGNIYKVENPKGNEFDVVSDGSDWYACNNGFKTDQGQKLNFNEKVLAGHYYICYDNDGYAQLAECKGDGNSNNANENTFGRSFSTGEFIIINSTKYYCTDNYNWTIDLDLTNQHTCEAAGFEWTGSKCCGDKGYLGGQFESYNDIRDGCLKNEKVANNTQYSQESRILNYNGEFFSCNLLTWDAYDDTNTPDSNDLIKQNFASCGGKGDFFCDPASNQWSSETAGAPAAGSRNTIKEYQNSISCCPSDWCWNGNQCIENMAGTTNETGDEIIEDNEFKRCIDGNWTVSYITTAWDDVISGYCPATSDCLVDPNGNFSSNYIPENYGTAQGNPQCIGSTQAVLDHYCDNNQWTSRTKFIASQLLSLAGSNYILFCDSYTTSLNDFKFTPTIEDYLGGPLRDIPPIYRIRACIEPVSALYELPCVNNFCILSSNNKIYFGTSLDQPVNAPQNSILEALEFDIDYCSGISGDAFQKCSNDDKIWYNPELNSIIYIKDGQSSMPTPDQNEIPSKLDPVVNYVKDEITFFGAKIYSWIDAKDYNKLYLNKQGSKEIYAIYEISKTDPYFAIKYVNLDADMCLTTSRLTGIECKQSGNSYYIASQSPRLSEFWPELTSKIRLQG